MTDAKGGYASNVYGECDSVSGFAVIGENLPSRTFIDVCRRDNTWLNGFLADCIGN